MFLVVWSGRGFGEMARIVQLHPGRKAEFAAALRQISERLARDPSNEGESREEEMRVMFADQLSVFYSIDEAHQTVEIGNVRLRRS